MTPLHAIQQSRLNRFSAAACVDAHCHILPGIDDGPADLEETLALCRMLVRDGITTVIATPHQLGRYEGQNQPAQVRQAVAELQKTLDARRIPIRLLSGGEVRIDERIGQFLADDRVLTLGDARKHLLLELPSSVPMDPARIMPHLVATGATVVLAHAERYDNLQSDPESAQGWIDAGAALQVNAGCVVGSFGKPSENAAWKWLGRGWVSLIATDAHSVGKRRPRMTDAIDAISHRLGEPIARCVCIDNPNRVAEGMDLAQPPVASTPPSSEG